MVLAAPSGDDPGGGGGGHESGVNTPPPADTAINLVTPNKKMGFFENVTAADFSPMEEDPVVVVSHFGLVIRRNERPSPRAPAMYEIVEKVLQDLTALDDTILIYNSDRDLIAKDANGRFFDDDDDLFSYCYQQTHASLPNRYGFYFELHGSTDHRRVQGSSQKVQRRSSPLCVSPCSRWRFCSDW